MVFDKPNSLKHLSSHMTCKNSVMFAPDDTKTGVIYEQISQ